MADIDPALMAAALSRQEQPQTGKGALFGGRLGQMNPMGSQQQPQPLTGKGTGISANMQQPAPQAAPPPPQALQAVGQQAAPKGGFGKSFGQAMPQVPQQRYMSNFRQPRQMGPAPQQGV